jgi:hypothetical protein
VRNTGAVPVAPAPSLTSTQHFQITSGCTTPLAAGATCNLHIEFDPLDIGQKSTTLNVAGGVSRQLTGEGIGTPSCGNIAISTVVNTPVQIGAACSGHIESISAFNAVGGGVTPPPVGGTTMVFTPQGGFTGTGTFKYQASNEAGNSGTATVTVSVVNPPPPPPPPPPAPPSGGGGTPAPPSTGGTAPTIFTTNRTTT